MLKTFKEIIDIWGTTSRFADDIGVTYQTAAAMKQRDSIPAKYWQRILNAAERRGFAHVTHEALTSIAHSK